MGSKARDERFDERSLVETARHDPDAFAALYRRYVDPIHAYAYRRSGSVAIADDVTSATFEKALRNLSRFRWREPGIGPWLFRIAANELVDHHRRGDRQHRLAERVRTATLTSKTTADLGEQHGIEDLDELRTALDQIPARYQQALSLRYLAGLSNEEAATAMGVSRAAMAVLVHRSLAALRRHVQQQRSQGGSSD